MIWAYAIVDEPALPPVAGMNGAPLTVVAGGGVHAVVSPVEGRPEPSAETLLAHEAVVGALTCAVLPLRFGTTFPSEADVARVLEENGPEWRALLDRLRGHVEIAATVVAPDSERGTDGRSYLLGKAADQRVARNAAERLNRAIAPLAHGVHTRLHPAPGVAVKAAYLVPRDDAPEACRRAEEAGAVCTGPWPPYSFTSPDRLETTA